MCTCSGRPAPITKHTRAAALIATALAIPVVIVVALALAPSSSSDAPKASSTAVVSVSAPTPSPDALEPCAQVLSALPVQLDGYNPRQVHPYPDEGAPAVAWGDPAIVFQCGVARPAELVANSSAFVSLIDGVNWLPIAAGNATAFTVIDRSVYIRVTVPKSYPQPPLAPISDAIAKVLPAVCTVAPDNSTASPAPTDQLCTRRP